MLGYEDKRKVFRARRLVDLLNGRAVIAAGAARSASGHAAAGHTARHTATLTASSVELHHDGVGNALELLLLALVFVLGSGLVLVEPCNGRVDGLLERLLVTSVEFLVDLGV
jgi:hypothetical protein